MHRCDQSVGAYRVRMTTVRYDDDEGAMVDGENVGFKLEIPAHAFDMETRDGSPVLVQNEPWEGELCVHELRWLRGMPGVHFNHGWRFEVTPLDEPKSAKKG
jgi:hypothetical protein